MGGSLSCYFSFARLRWVLFQGLLFFVLEEKDVAGFAGAIFHFCIFAGRMSSPP